MSIVILNNNTFFSQEEILFPLSKDKIISNLLWDRFGLDLKHNTYYGMGDDFQLILKENLKIFAK